MLSQQQLPSTICFSLVLHRMLRIYKHWCTSYLVFQIQLGAWPSPVEGFLPEPLGPDLQPAATRCAAGWPGWPVTELTVKGARDVANLHHVAWNWTLADRRGRPDSDLVSGLSEDHINNVRQTCHWPALRQTLDLLTMTPRANYLTNECLIPTLCQTRHSEAA